VADDRKERIFELSFSTNPQGMGYGLALVRNNLRRFGGAVAETGLEGHGAQFDLYLPVATQEAISGTDGGRYS
ncbi:MAG: ATP-binding protein, partial [Acidobacteriota bacterium]